jgi:hypothetical protein
VKHYWLMIASCAMAGCVFTGSEPLPKIARDLPSVVAAARPAFDRRVKSRFPLGSQESALLNELRIEGFTITSTNPASAALTVHHLACNLRYSIRWRAENRKITSVAGDYDPSCL